MNSVLVPIQLFCMFRFMIIPDCYLYVFENHINSADAVTLNAFEKAYNRYKQEMKPLYHKQWGTQT